MTSHHDRKAWAEYHKEQVRAGNYIRRGSMKLVKDSAGAYYKANSKSCCGCGYDQQSRDESAPDAGGLGNPDRRGKPPVLDDGSSKGVGFLSWLFGG